MPYSDEKRFRKPTKTISGVTPLAAVIKPKPCPHGKCIYCPSLNVPQSYTPESPAIIRAKNLDYDPYEQVKSRLKAFYIMRHPTDKIELIIMGGTFLAYPKSYQANFIKRCYDALNNKESKSLAEAKKLNEKAKNRCVALCIETRPDICSEKEIKRMLDFGATRCELGVQITDDKIYKKVNRGHKIKDVVEATARLKDAGFKIGYHVMPGLPGSNMKKDISLFKKLFSDERFKPDQLKIYPCQVIKGSELEKIYIKGKYEPYSDKELVFLLMELKKLVPEYCRIMRVMREIPPSYLVAGTLRIDLRKVIGEEMRKKHIKCRCIRCREIGLILRDNHYKKIDNTLRIKTLSYNASEGKEFFLQFVNKDNIIFGLCRLRIKDNIAFIRELHVFGKQTEIGKKGNVQHKGIGKTLMKEAEKMAKKEKCRRIYVISGVGAREYYRKLGYVLEGDYMAKRL